VTWDAEPQRYHIRCSEAGCRETVEWSAYNRKTKKRYYFCEEHVPPLGTPRISKYDYFGAIRHCQEEDFEEGDRVQILVGGKVSRGTIKCYDHERAGWTIEWDAWLTESGFPSHKLGEINPLEQLAECAEEPPWWKKDST
jgi:hypothetical protein